MSRLFFFFFETLVVLTLVARVYSFRSPMCFRLWPWNLFFLSLLSSFLVNSIASSYDGADFGSLGLVFLEWDKSLEPWVYTFEEVLWDGRWPLGQQASESRIMVLDLWPALTSAFTTLCTISLKLVDAWSYCSISTLIEGLRPSQK